MFVLRCSGKPARPNCHCPNSRIHFASLQITARELRGGAIIFLSSETFLQPRRSKSDFSAYEHE